MTDARVLARELRILMEKATPGPWVAFNRSKTLALGTKACVDFVVHWTGFDACYAPMKQRRANLELIAAMRNALPVLLSALEREPVTECSLLCYMAENAISNQEQPSMTKLTPQARHRSTGRYSFDGDMSKLCVCGHTLGIHAAEAPHECFNQDAGLEGATGEPCDCMKFRLPRRKS